VQARLAKRLTQLQCSSSGSGVISLKQPEGLHLSFQFLAPVVDCKLDNQNSVFCNQPDNMIIPISLKMFKVWLKYQSEIKARQMQAVL